MADFESDRQTEARLAYGDPERSVEVHGKKMETFNVDIRKNGAMKNRTFVLGSVLGLLSGVGTLGVMGGSGKALEFLGKAPNCGKGLLWLVASGCCVLFTVTTRYALERTIYDLELRRELWEIENHLTGELQEMVSIYKEQGLNEEEAHIVTRIFAQKKLMFANLMMVEELGYSRLEPPSAAEALINAGVPSLVGYVVGAVLPFAPVAALAQLSAAPPEKACQYLCGATVLVGSVAVSAVQTEIFFGAYTRTSTLVKATAVTTLAVSTVFALCIAASRLFTN